MCQQQQQQQQQHHVPSVHDKVQASINEMDVD